ncbi:helix-turn-helix transcriptional regulator [Chondrinema litorale]|uniref:helix-turn-helix transcriptional regulator n=1 Tax=Chondrinema litorale TaxID=2994555 RepID=UPI00254277AC|nr:helix-turn-helix transcriptional regulator [Chondrinema litorale]UZR98067.1 helix-turn-helix transcriptional regulator [Chondrinema litorale]
MINLHQAFKETNIHKKVIIQDMLCVEYKCMETNKFSNFWIDCACLVYCLSGKRIYSSNSQEYIVEAGTFMYMKKGGYTVEVFQDEAYCALMFFMPDSFFQNFLLRYPTLKIQDYKHVNLQNKIIDLTNGTTAIQAYFYSISNYFAHENSASKQILHLKLEELSFNIFTQSEYKQLASYLSTLEENREAQLKLIMEENFASNLRLEEFAELCNMSLSTFKRQFTKLYNAPPAKWLLSRRLQLSKKLLIHSDKNINEISFIAGFESPSHYSRVFKNTYHCNPLKYREKHIPKHKNFYKRVEFK